MMVETLKNNFKRVEGKHKVDGFNLDSIGDLSNLLNSSKNTLDSIKPMMLDISLIDEDLNQPRSENNPGFTFESLSLLATTISSRGVKTPISVRNSLDVKERYIINHGARRFRASKLAEKTHIPAFIDNDYSKVDQIIENIQRNELTPREIADYIGRELAKNRKKVDIAKELGKSAAFVTQHVTLLDLPESIAEIFSSGRIRDVTVVNELVTMHKNNPLKIDNWLTNQEQEFTRSSIRQLREVLDKAESYEDIAQLSPTKIDNKNEESHDTKKNKKKSKELNTDKLRIFIVQVCHENRLAQLVLNKRPSTEGAAWMKYDDGEELEIKLQDVTLISLIEG